MKRDAASRPTRSRARKKVDPASTPAPATDMPAIEEPVAPSERARNVNKLEGSVSVTAGVLLLIAVLFPRSIKQLLLLSLGGWLTYRGVTGRCDLYALLGMDTEKGPLLQQVNERILARVAH